jgi:hypothetical protein
MSVLLRFIMKVAWLLVSLSSTSRLWSRMERNVSIITGAVQLFHYAHHHRQINRALHKLAKWKKGCFCSLKLHLSNSPFWIKLLHSASNVSLVFGFRHTQLRLMNREICCPTQGKLRICVVLWRSKQNECKNLKCADNPYKKKMDVAEFRMISRNAR